MHKKILVATISAVSVFVAASTSLADPLKNQTLELTETQLDAVTAGSIGADAEAAAGAIGSIIAVTLTDSTALVGASFFGEEIRGTAGVGQARGVAIAAGEGASRATFASSSLDNPEGTTFSRSGVFNGGVIRLEYSTTAGYSNIGFAPIN
jgi:hypothetical protein